MGQQAGIDERVGTVLALLRDRGADSVDHPGGTLLRHLIRVRELLAEWDASDDVQLAGLCHAAYGTDGFAVRLFEIRERATVQAAIGPEAERLVYLYGSCARREVYPQLERDSVAWHDRFTGDVGAVAGADLRALMEITAANELDVVRHSTDVAQRFGASLQGLFTRTGQHLSAPARQAWASAPVG